MDVIGKEFYFCGDWQTEPGRWRVINERDECHAYLCEPLDKSNRFHGQSWFWEVKHLIENSVQKA